MLGSTFLVHTGYHEWGMDLINLFINEVIFIIGSVQMHWLELANTCLHGLNHTSWTHNIGHLSKNSSGSISDNLVWVPINSIQIVAGQKILQTSNAKKWKKNLILEFRLIPFWVYPNAPSGEELDLLLSKFEKKNPLKQAPNRKGNCLKGKLVSSCSNKNKRHLNVEKKKNFH